MATSGTEGIQPGSGADEFFRELQESGTLPAGVDARDAASGVLCTLALRLSAGEAGDFFDSLPPGLRGVVQSCSLHRDTASQLFGRDEFLRKIAHHCGIRVEEAGPLARTVLAAVRRRLPEGEVHGVEGQLPKELKELWLGA
jgi:uncharacterized protein (DUF2267 family)